MADRVELAFRRSARALLSPGASILVAVSGGGDSVALLHLLARTSRSSRWQLTVAHLDHAMRRGSRSDLGFVESLADDLGLPFRADRREVAALRRRDESPEEAARRVRRQFLLETSAEAGAAFIALGHTRDDQAETILLRLARGAGPSALSGMSTMGPGPFARPLLDLGREELREWLARKGIPFRDDPSNRRLDHDRNRLRLRVVPHLLRLNPGALRHVCEAASRLRADSSLLDRLAAETESSLVSRTGSGDLRIDVGSLTRLDPALASRVARRTLEKAGCDPRRIGSRHVSGLLALACGEGRASLDLPNGVAASRSGGTISVRRRAKRLC